jgi:hypothetical protein
VFDLFNKWDSDGDSDEVVVEDAAVVMKDLALMVISSAGMYLLKPLLSSRTELPRISVWNEFILERRQCHPTRAQISKFIISNIALIPMVRLRFVHLQTS